MLVCNAILHICRRRAHNAEVSMIKHIVQNTAELRVQVITTGLALALQWHLFLEIGKAKPLAS